MICPQCRSADCFRSRRARAGDLFATVVGLRPWRCRTCDKRFYAGRVAMPFARFAHCPRCGNFDLQRLPPNRVDRGMLLFAKRFLGLPAYRCEPCRLRFFSILPPRRIVPSTIVSQRRTA